MSDLLNSNRDAGADATKKPGFKEQLYALAFFFVATVAMLAWIALLGAIPVYVLYQMLNSFS